MTNLIDFYKLKACKRHVNSINIEIGGMLRTFQETRLLHLNDLLDKSKKLTQQLSEKIKDNKKIDIKYPQFITLNGSPDYLVETDENKKYPCLLEVSKPWVTIKFILVRIDKGWDLLFIEQITNHLG